MSYSLKRIIHNLKRHLIVYLLFVVLFAAGIMILSSALNVLLTAKKELKAQQAEMLEEKTVDLVANIQGTGEEPLEAESLKQVMEVSYDIYLKLKEKYKEDYTFQYGVETNYISAFVFRKEDEAFMDANQHVNVWFVNDELFEAYFGVPMEQGKIYAGENAYEVLLQLNEMEANPDEYAVNYLPTNVLWAENGEYKVARKDAFELEKMPPSEKTRLWPSIPDWTLYNEPKEDEYYEPNLVDCIFIPMSEFPVYEEYYDSLDWDGELKDWPRGSFNTLQKAQYKTSKYEEDSILKMLNYLSEETHLKERNISVEFTLDAKQLEMQEFVEYLGNCMSNYLVMAISVLLVVMLGTSGLFLIFLYRRKKQMAVSIAYGSTRGRLFLELFTEIFTITGIGAGVGLWALRFTEEFFHTFYAEAVFQMDTAGIAFLIAFLTALFTSVLAFVGVGEIAPARVLKEL